MNNVKVVQYGCGKMSVYTMRYVIENGGSIVGAVDINPSIIGKDISTVICGKEIGVNITSVDDAEEMLKREKPDVCIITTMSLMKDVLQEAAEVLIGITQWIFGEAKTALIR